VANISSKKLPDINSLTFSFRF